MTSGTIEAVSTMRAKFFTETLPPPTTVRRPNDGSDGPSWGLIIPIIMIGVFLTSVALCLWWHKWRDKRTLHIQRDHNASSFHRSYRGSRSNRSGFDAVRDSTRSTTPLRSSLNEKTTNNNIVKVKSVNVIPVQQRPPGVGKYSLYWDKINWKGYPTPTALSSSGRMGTKPLSPINEIESPSSMKLSELSRNYDMSAQASFSPYHLTWYSSANLPLSHEQAEIHNRGNRANRYPPTVRRSSEGFTPTHTSYEPAGNSPFYPNNNTPTTECDTSSEASQLYRVDSREAHAQGSQYTSYPSSPKSSVSNTRLSVSTDTEANRTCQTGTSYPESSFRTCTTSRDHSNSGYQTSMFPSGHTSTTEHTSTNFSSLPSSIAPFSKQNLPLDDNNNSVVVPNAYISYPMSKVLNYTLASSLASSDTHVSDNTSLLPNMGSNNTSGFPGTVASRSYHNSAGPSGPTSPEDLSKLVDEMSSIRPVEESSSMRPNSFLDPALRIVSISGNSNIYRSWSVVGDMERASMTSANTGSQSSSQNGSLYWDSYPLNQGSSKSYPDLPLQMHDSFVQQAHQYNYQRPVLMETQYWV